MDKMHMLLSVVWTTIFATLAFFNYICQTTFVHHLATHYQPGYDAAIATLSMANPASLSWSVEMWGYAFLGLATWHLSAYYREKNRRIYGLLMANGVVSIASAVAFVMDDRWLLTTAGLISYFCWNLFMIILLWLINQHSKRTEEAISPDRKQQNQSTKKIAAEVSQNQNSRTIKQMNLPFTTEPFLAVFQSYNQPVFPFRAFVFLLFVLVVFLPSGPSKTVQNFIPFIPRGAMALGRSRQSQSFLWCRRQSCKPVTGRRGMFKHFAEPFTTSKRTTMIKQSVHNRLRKSAIVLLFIVSLNALAAGYSFITDPSGKGIGISPAYLRPSAPFKDYLVPGVILFAVIGVQGFVIAVMATIRRKHYPFLVLLQGCLLVGWIAVQLTMVTSVHPLHLIIGLGGVTLLLLGWLINQKRITW